MGPPTRLRDALLQVLAGGDALDLTTAAEILVATFRELEKIYRRRDASAALARVLGAEADIVERAGELDQALTLHEEALRLAPEDPDVLDVLIDLHVRMRHYAEAARELEKYLDRRPPEAQRIRTLFRLAEIASAESIHENWPLASG